MTILWCVLSALAVIGVAVVLYCLCCKKEKSNGSSTLTKPLIELDEETLKEWADLKKEILAAVKKNEQQNVFEALHDDVTKFIAKVEGKGMLDAISVTLQDDAQVFFDRRRVLDDAASKQTLQKICNLCKN